MSETIHQPAAVDASLHLLADHLLDALDDGQIQPSLLRVSDVDGSGFDLGLLDLEGRHPTAMLVGATAPASWHAMGMAVRGHAHRLGPGTSIVSGSDSRVSATVVVLVARSGEHVHRVRVDGADDLDDGEIPTGEQVDLLRRCLGMPTDPPPCDAREVLLALWMQRLATDAEPWSGWRDLVGLHPALVDRPGRLPVAGLSDGELIRWLLRTHGTMGWSQLRALVQAGDIEVAGLRRSDAAWFDDGSFARFVLNRLPLIRPLYEDVADVVSPELFAELLDLCRRLVDRPATRRR